MRSTAEGITTARRNLKQIELIDKNDLKKRENFRSWERSKVNHQLYFIATHQFRKKVLYQFCKEHNLKVSGTKADQVIRIWEAGYEFSDVNADALQCKLQAENTHPKMLVVERIQLKKSKQLYHLCHLSKNLYNEANYLVKTTYNTETVANGKNKWIRYRKLNDQLKSSNNYKDLPSQVSQQVLRLVDHNWMAFFHAIKDWKVNPDKYERKPKPPRYKPKDGENLLIFTNQEARIKYNKQEKKYYIHFNYKANLSSVPVNGDRVRELHQVRILPRGCYYILEIVYEKEIIEAKTSKDRMIGIDLGVRNIVTVVNNVGLCPFIVKGGLVKSINQYYNKLLAKAQTVKEEHGIKRSTMRTHRLRRTRNNKINDLFHKLSRALIDYCLVNKIGRVVIGYNEGWKHKCQMGKKNNQNFVSIPFHRLLNQLSYKGELVGIEVVKVEESHTSKCSFLDGEPIEHHDIYVGTRGVYRSKKVGGNGKVSHGLFKTAAGKIINSDVNGAYNIMRKAFPKAIQADRIEGLGLIPYSVKFAELKQLANLKSPHKHSRKQNADGIQVLGRSHGDPLDH